MKSDTRPMPHIAKVVMALLLLASLGITLLLIVGSFAGVVAILRWLSSVLLICPT